MKIALKFIRPEMENIKLFAEVCDEITSAFPGFNFVFIVPPHCQVPLRAEITNYIVITAQKVVDRKKVYDRTLGCTGLLDNVPASLAHDIVLKFFKKNLNLKLPLAKAIVSFNPESNPIQRVGFFSTWNIRCGIAVYTKHLSDTMRAHGFSVFNYPHNMDLQEIYSNVLKDNVQVLYIQHEPSIMPDDRSLAKFVKRIRKNGIKVGMTFHSESKITDSLVADFYIFHKSSPKMDALENSFLIPMSVPVFDSPDTRTNLRQKYGYAEDDKIIATVGFAFRWKNFPNILSELVPFLSSNKNVKLQMITSINDMNPDECYEQVALIRQIINDNGLQDQVICLSDFIPQQELSERLFISDLGYLWSGISTTSSSAAGKEFITARLPLVITDSNHYHDLITGTIKTEQNDKGFAKIIIQSILDRPKLDSLRSDMQYLYDKLNYNTSIQKYIKVAYK